jgi:hypothetical protein
MDREDNAGENMGLQGMTNNPFTLCAHGYGRPA